MRNGRLASALAACLGLAVAGCYQTQLSVASARPDAEVHEARQWFTVGGLVRISDPTGTQCGSSGASYVASGQSGTDVGVIVGLSLLGALVAPIACESITEIREYAECVSGVTALPPFLIAPRTVKFQCAR